MSALKYWVWLSSKRSIKNISHLLDRFGSPEGIYFADKEDLIKTGLSGHDINLICNRDLDEIERIIEVCVNKDISIVTIQDTIYPDVLRNISNPPLVLYLKGRLPLMDDEIGIAVVGTRRPTAYGISMAQSISYNLAKSGCIIVSGMALGLDAVALKSGIKAGAQTVAVMGCGLDICYPSENRRLMDDIIATGAVISEYHPGIRPDAKHFPQRNRIISGICKGTLIVEAPKRSGALITAESALEQSRDVFAIPGNADNPNSYGCNHLIQQGAAKLVMNYLDILQEYEIFIKDKVESLGKDNKPSNNTNKKINLTDDELKVYNAIKGGCNSADRIIEKTGLEPANVMTILTILEINVIIKKENGFIFL